MTAKEKAEELIERFYKCMPFRDVKLTSCDEKPELIIKMEKLSAKQSALVAVDEIIQEYQDEICEVGYDYDWSMWENRKKFWEDVKDEIERL